MLMVGTVPIAGTEPHHECIAIIRSGCFCLEMSYARGIFVLGMVQDRLFALDRLLPLPAVGLEDFVESEALHTSRRTVKLI